MLCFLLSPYTHSPIVVCGVNSWPGGGGVIAVGVRACFVSAREIVFVILWPSWPTTLGHRGSGSVSTLICWIRWN